MTPKNKKNARKKKNYKRRKINTNNTVTEIEGQKPTVGQENKKGTDKPKKMPRLQKNCLSLIEQTTRKLKEDDSGKLVVILEGIFSIFNDDLKKKVARLELIDKLLSNVKEYETEDIGGLKIQLNSMFFPKELKKLMVDASDLRETFNPLLFLLGLGMFEGDTYLDKGGRKIRVEIKEAHGTKDKLTVIQEAKTLSQLNHDNIVKILAFDKKGPRFAIEYMKLGNLSDALEQYHFTSQKMLNVLKNVASAMVYLSEKQYVLRNLSSENILLDANGICKISDFRYCQYVGDDPDGTYIDQNTTLDLDFAAPEVKEEKRFSTKSDVWDFALLACEVFNVNPEKAMDCFLPEMLRPVLFSMFVSEEVFPLPPKCPYPLWFYLETLLGEDPKMRPTFKEILEELKEYDSWQLD